MSPFFIRQAAATENSDDKIRHRVLALRVERVQSNHNNIACIVIYARVMEHDFGHTSAIAQRGSGWGRLLTQPSKAIERQRYFSHFAHEMIY